jgi:AP-1-like factor
LTSEPTTKRKAQNRAAQRAFRERKERHLKDLETKVEDLEKASESATHENGLLRAQVERLQVELKEYRKRLSWVSSNGLSKAQSVSPNQNRNLAANNHSDFQFEFPKFGDLPPMPATNIFDKSKAQKSSTDNANRAASIPTPSATPVTKNINPTRSSSASTSQQNQQVTYGSMSQSPMNNGFTASPKPQSQPKAFHDSVDSLTGLFSPSILEATRHASLGGYFPQTNLNNGQSNRGSLDNGAIGHVPGLYPNSTISTSDSPSSCTESQNAFSSIGTSPEPSLNSPANKLTEYNLNPISEETQLPFGGYTAGQAFDSSGFNWLAQQNNNTFDPVLFGDYRETQENVLAQDFSGDFGAFFNDAYPLPDLGSPLHNYNDVSAEQQMAKNDLMKQVDQAQNEEIGPGTDKAMTCNKIWDRLQSMEKFRNGEIDIDNLCSELRAKAKCSEGGAVVDKKDVDIILGVAR